MRIYGYSLAWASAFIFSSTLVAEEKKCSGKNWAELAQHVAEASPPIQVLSEAAQAREAALASSTLGPPSLASGQYTAGGPPWKSSSLEASYLWTLEPAAKVKARRAAAQADADASRIEVDELKAFQLLQLALMQHAARRLEARREVLLETESTYRKIIRQYEARLTLGPEQEASLAVFRIAKKENDLKIEALEVEKSQWAYKLAALSGCAKAELPPAAPRALDLELPAAKSPGISPAIQRLEAKAKALDLSLEAEIQSYGSDLSIGPLVVAERSDDENRVQFGIAASLPIGGARSGVISTAKSAEQRARRSAAAWELRKLKIEREAWLEQYQKSVQAMKGGLSREDFAETHKKLETLFQGERVSAALIIESHRQLLEHTEIFSDLEAKAWEAIWNIRYLDGALQWRDL